MAGKVRAQRGPGSGSFHGRAGRAEFWTHVSINTVVGAIASSIPYAGPLLAVPWTIGALAVTSRRLHDIERSGWWQVAPMIVGVPFIATLAYMTSQGLVAHAPPPVWANMLTWLGVVWAVAYVALVVWLGFTPGASGPNRFGEADLNLLESRKRRPAPKPIKRR